MKILFLGGGTAGHIFPLLSVRNAFLEQFPKMESFFVVADNQSDEEIMKKNNLQYAKMPVAKLRRYFSWENFLDFFQFFKNFHLAYRILKTQKPDALFSKGGFVSLPVGIVAFFLQIPLFLHETDAAMGISNRILSIFAQKIFTGFPSENPKHIFVGNPVRKEFFEKKISLAPAMSGERVGVRGNCVLKMLITGGSQGAMALNQWARNFFLSKKWQKFLQEKNIKMNIFLLAGKNKTKIPFQKNPFLEWKEQEFLFDDFVEVVKNSDLIITRSGGSVSECAAAQKPILLVPLPTSANNHQWKNADFFAKKNAALMLEEKKFSAPETFELLQKFCTDFALQKTIAENLSEFASEKTAEKIVHEIILSF